MRTSIHTSTVVEVEVVNEVEVVEEIEVDEEVVQEIEVGIEQVNVVTGTVPTDEVVQDSIVISNTATRVQQ